MKNKHLSDLNFLQLLDYGGQPKVQVHYSPPLTCTGYCIACEESGRVFDKASDGFDQMSHGCDTSDYESLLGPLPNRTHNAPTVFLLENPGGDYKNGQVVPYQGYKKQPPVNHYYWAPSITQWPNNYKQLPHLYGPYFAYLMHKHGLGNVYITNVIKCNTITDHNNPYKKSAAIDICTRTWLKKEIDIISSKYVFCFGGNAFHYFSQYLPDHFSETCCVVKLYHPAARKSRADIVENNDREISAALLKC